ncbi:hypothetical protein D8S82_00570 [Mycobacterium hodleri]|uniref:Uncharacterized protein n=1 Tax=Mycolicibacterium hodleri TaxID=49897 RepID=A0A544W8G3_9MYCO|nr:hypothetical protein [Mycolicibacterium hodleri]TQR88537.1 hypothetical protein D8S82_00570 [Mycolicibacterium hodleri]
MALDNSSLMGFAVLGSMKKAERKRAQTPLVLTLIPGAPATRAAIASVAVGTQARDGLRREKRAAAATVSAVTAILSGEEPASAFAAQPALRDLAPDQLALQLGTAVSDYAVALQQATDMLIEAIGKRQNELFTVDEAAKYVDYLGLLSDETRDSIVNPVVP